MTSTPDLGGSGSFEKWIAAYEHVYLDPAAISSVRCPHCGEQTLNLVFVVEELGDTRGTALFWCGSCLRGLPPNRAQLPASDGQVVRGKEQIPDYQLVIDAG